ncbi:MAG: hypothetical protein AAB619_04090 [Patescibacteria group bacterium]
MPKPSRTAAKLLTRDDLKAELGGFRDGVREEMKGATREIISHFNASQGKQDELIKEEFSTINTKLDAIMSGEVLVTRKQFQRLLRTLVARCG